MTPCAQLEVAARTVVRMYEDGLLAMLPDALRTLKDALDRLNKEQRQWLI